MQDNESAIKLFHVTPAKSAIEILKTQKILAHQCVDDFKDCLEQFQPLKNEKFVWLTKNEWIKNGNFFGSVQFSIKYEKLLEKNVGYILKEDDKSALILFLSIGKNIPGFTKSPESEETLKEIINSKERVNFLYTNDISLDFVDNISFISVHDNADYIKKMSSYDYSPGHAAVLFLRWAATGIFDVKKTYFSKKSSYLSAGFNEFFRLLTWKIKWQKKVSCYSAVGKSIIKSSIITYLFSKDDARNLISLFEDVESAEIAYFAFWDELFGCNVREKFEIPE